MSSDILVRQANQSDVPALVRLLQRSWLVAWAPELPFVAVQAFAAFDPAREHAEADWREFVVATSTDKLVGMVQVRDEFIHALHVDPAHWGKGIGFRLLTHAEEKISSAFPVARLEVRSFNTRARAFYSHHGWREVRSYSGTECGSPVTNYEMQKALHYRS